MPNITTFEVLDQEIQKAGGKPVVLEALWDGDTQGWYLYLSLYVEKGSFPNKSMSRHSLGQITLGSDIRVFSGGAWTEAFLAKELAAKAMEKYPGLEFYFPSDTEPDDDCPAWTERHKAIRCADCNKLIIPTTSPYLPKDICYHCHLARERNEKIRNETPCDDGVTLYRYKDGEYRSAGYCTHFESFPIAPYVKEKVDKELSSGIAQGITLVTLEKAELIALCDKLEERLDELVNTFETAPVRKSNSFAYMISTQSYKGVDYTLDRMSGKNHDEMGRLIENFNAVREAIAEEYVYRFYFKKGISYRDDTILRFVNYVSKGSTDINSINVHYKKVLSEEEVLTTLRKLEGIGCLTIHYGSVSMTETGKRIV